MGMLFSNGLRTSQGNRVALSLASLLAGTAGLTVTLLVSTRTEAPRREVSAALSPSRVEERETGDFRLPDGFAQRAVEFCAKEVTLDRSFVVFRNGTCVLVREPVEDPLVAAREILSAVARPGAMFATAATPDGAVMVTYRERLFQHFGKEDIAVMADLLSGDSTPWMTPAERAARRDSAAPAMETKLGLLGRRCLMKDAEELNPARIIRERRNQIASSS